MPDRHLPDDFDPQVYLMLHADVAAAKLDAGYHYLAYGHKEGRPYKGSVPFDRTGRLRALFDTSGFGLEVGPSYNPLLPKSEGFNVQTLDHADQAALQKKYADNAGRIEPVDFVSDGRSMTEVIGGSKIYDFIFASHVIEHTTDLVGFLKDCETLLKPAGRLILAVPDRRYCFDFFRPTSSLGQILEAHLLGRTRHSPATVFDCKSLSCKRDNITWSASSPEPFQLLAGPKAAYREMLDSIASGDYIDMHGWTFTPSSFRYHLKALGELGLVGLREEVLQLTGAFEFYVVLTREAAPTTKTYLELLTAAASEQREFLLPGDDAPSSSGE